MLRCLVLHQQYDDQDTYQSEKEMKSIIATIVTAVVFVLGLFALFSTWYTVDQGDRGVLLTNGAYVGTSEPGLHFKLPFIQDVVYISVRQQVARWTCPIGKERCDYHSGDGVTDDYVMQSYSRDQQPADMQVSVTWHITDAEVRGTYENYGSLDALARRTIWRKAPQAIKTVFGQYDAVSVIQNRAKFNSDIQTAVSEAIDGPLTIDAVQVENIDFSDAYEQAVEARMTAQVEVQKQEQQLNQEKIKAEIAVTQAQGRADSVKAEADAAAYQTRQKGLAEAEAIAARGKALRDNPSIIALTQAEKWDGVLPTTIPPNGTVPFLNLQ
jgi:regulator of protease activity HflC (stomatin/prohibitin superfamily)